MAAQYITENYLYNTLNKICAKVDSTFSKKSNSIKQIEIGMARPTGSIYTNKKKCIIITYDDDTVFNLQASDLIGEIAVATDIKTGGVLAETVTDDDINYTSPVKIDTDGRMFVPQINTASISEIGLVKPDGSTIIINKDGTISSVVAEIPAATNDELGLVKPDNKTLTVDAEGTLKIINPSGATSPDGTILTNVSELVNDIGYITNADLPTKVSELDNDNEYITLESVPTKVSELENDAKYVIESAIPLATDEIVGGIKAEKMSDNEHNTYTLKIKLDDDGFLFGNLPSAKSTTLGGVKAKTIESTEKASYTIEIKIDNNGNLYSYIPKASSTALGGVKVESITDAEADNYIIKVKADSDGNIYIPADLSSYNNDVEFAETTDIPTKVSELENDEHYATTSEIPTKVSALENDSDYATVSDIPTKVSELENDSNFLSEIQAATASEIGGVKPDGSTIMVDSDGTIHAIDQRTLDPSGQVVVYISSLVNDKGYITASNIPKNVSEFKNDINYITRKDIPTNLSDYGNDIGYITKADIPTKISDFYNDANYAKVNQIPKIDNSTIVVDENGKWKISDSFKSETLYTDAEVNSAIDAILK